jgi:hypothetical protein
MRFILLLTFFSIFFTKSRANGEKDEVLKVKKTPFLKDFFKREGFIYPALGAANTFLHPIDPVFAAKPQILLKNGKTVSISLAASGRVYECIGEDDSSFIFKRRDNTTGQNYNIGGYYFYNRGRLFCYSGYGFWKNNGTLKVFNVSDQEWDLIPLTKEVMPQLFPMGSTWYDDKSQNLYVPFQSFLNAGIQGEENLRGIVEPSAMILDLKKIKWKKTGEASEQTIDLITNGSLSLSTSHGLLFMNDQDLYLMDYKNNNILKSVNVSLNQSILRAHQRSFLYQYKNQIYFYNPDNGSSDSASFRISDFENLSTPIWKQKESTLLFAGSLISICLFLIFLFLTQRKSQEQLTLTDLQPGVKKTIEFNDIEKSLLRLLWNKTNKGLTATVGEVNYALGVKDKKTGLQKKVRSDVFNSINAKYNFLTHKNESLIQVIRSVEDKRFFEFSLSVESIDKIKECIS